MSEEEVKYDSLNITDHNMTPFNIKYQIRFIKPTHKYNDNFYSPVDILKKDSLPRPREHEKESSCTTTIWRREQALTCKV